MGNDLEDFIAQRCEKALTKDENYSILQNKLIEACKQKDIDAYGEVTIKMQQLTEIISYRTAVKDLMQLMY